jgi:hypothetical protein
MEAVARDRLHQNVDEGLRVPRHAIVKGTPPFHLAAEGIDAHHSGRLCSDLDERFSSCDRSAEHGGDSDHPFPSNGCDLHNSAILHNVRDRTHASSRKINLRHGLTVLVKHLPYF